MACFYILVLFSDSRRDAFLPFTGVNIDQAEAIPLDLDSAIMVEYRLVERVPINDKFFTAGVSSSSRFLCSTPIGRAFCDGLSMGWLEY